MMSLPAEGPAGELWPKIASVAKSKRAKKHQEIHFEFFTAGHSVMWRTPCTPGDANDDFILKTDILDSLNELRGGQMDNLRADLGWV